MKKKPRDRPKIPEILKHKWFKKHGFSFNLEEIKQERPIPDLVDALQQNLDDPFGKNIQEEEQALEREVEQEKAEKIRERENKLDNENLYDDGYPKLDIGRTQSDHTGVHQLHSNSLILNSEKEEMKLVSKKTSMKIIYKNNVTTFSTDSETPDDSLMMHIKKMALQPSSSYEGNFLDGPRSVPLIKKTSRIVEDIEENFSQFESDKPNKYNIDFLDASTQTLPQLIVTSPQDPRAIEMAGLLKQYEDDFIVSQMVEDQNSKRIQFRQKIEEIEGMITIKNIEIQEVESEKRLLKETKDSLEERRWKEAGESAVKIEENDIYINELENEIKSLKTSLGK